ncbi:MAG: S9 family peptidase [Blastocatellia bacterium]
MRSGRLKLALLSLVLLAAALPSVRAAADSPSAWTPDLMLKVNTITAVRPSPDGKKVAFTVTEPITTAERSEYVTQIHLANADGSGSMQITFADKSSSDPQWSPDGAYLAFTSSRSGKNNIHLMRLGGGEAEQLTSVKSAVAEFAWSPDGRSIAFQMKDPQTDDEEKATKAKDDWRWIDENLKLSQLYVLNIEKSPEGKREPRKLTSANFNVGSFDWSPDSKSIVFSHTRTPKANDWTTSDVSVVDLASGEAKTLVASGAAESDPLYSPDGKWIALVMTDDPPRWATDASIYVMPAAGGKPKRIAETPDNQPDPIGWSADGKRIFFIEARGTRTQIYSASLETGAITELSRNTAVCSAINLNRTRATVGFAGQAADRAPEAYVASLDSFSPVKVSHVNSDLPRLPLGRTEVIRWKSPDGMDVEGLLTYPSNYEAGKRAPLLLVVHGGPAGVFTQTFIGNRGAYPIAAFAARGYAVLRANPRGSSGYGVKFRRGNLKDWGGGDYQDLMTGVDQVIKMGVADPEKLGVMGWSYGGFMTSWIITHTKRFKVASVGAGVTNLMSFNGTADIPSFVPDYFGAEFWDDLETYRTHSAMFSVKGVATPTLIQHGEADDRVPISQGYELYNALKRQNVPVRMIVLPRQPHGPNEPRMVLKLMQTNLEWFEKYLGGSNAAAASR